MRRVFACATLAICSASALQAQPETRNWIYQWNYHYNIGGTEQDPKPNDPDPEYVEIDRDTGDVIIHQGIPGEPFSFEARTEEWNPETERWVDVGLGDINLIQADENAGEVTITVMPHIGRDYGARDVRAIDLGLDTQGVTGTIADLKLSADLGDPNLEPICADTISGLIDGVNVVNDVSVHLLAGGIDCTSLRNFSANLASGSGPGHTGSITVEGSYGDTMQFGGAMLGTITIEGTMSGLIEGTDDMAEITVDEDLTGDIQIGRDLTEQLWIGGDLTGGVQIGRNLMNRLWISNDLTGSITIDGNLMYSQYIRIAGNVWDESGDLSGGHIIINGSFMPNASVIILGQFLGNTEFVAIDYDGWDELDSWETGATIWVNDVPYYENTPSMHLWDIQPCKGDADNSGELDEEDLSALSLAIDSPGDYALQFPGLAGSMVWHADQNCDRVLDAVDESAAAFFVQDPPCCLYDAECTEFASCRADLNRDGGVGLEDLGTLLAANSSCEGDPDFNPDADLNGDGCVDLSDLAALLAVYGQTCSCFGGGEDGGGRDGSEGAGVSVAMEAYDTNGFEGDGFAGERDHFVFDLTAEVLDDADDWTASGVAIQAENGAVFRLAAEPTFVDPLASFVRAPQGGDADEPDAGTFVAGAFSPVDPLYDYEPELINLCWFDRVDSPDGPAAIMRVVIDVSGVSGADTSEGFGSVYFSQDGPHNAADIKVADFISATGTRSDAEGFTVLAGEFFVTGG